MPAVRGVFDDGAGIANAALRVRFLIDNALPPLLADLLVTALQDAVHVRSYSMQAASDDAILARALVEDRIVFCFATQVYWSQPITPRSLSPP